MPIFEYRQKVLNPSTLLQDNSVTADTASHLFTDYPNCGMRNNDTFYYNRTDDSFPDVPLYGSQATADWSVECLWDCTWQDSPFVGRSYLYNDTRNDSLQVRME